ncbi:DJ-1/PfpI family protein [Pantoea sp.]|uniref:DJ-1/PfpI family protein n=1 Tax=Pantoea sp. TaxID=69393 RepID=UPI0031DE669A
MAATSPLNIGFLLFPNLTQLDLTGPWEVFARMPNVNNYLIWKNRQPVMSDRGMAIVPTMTFNECPQLDLICIPGGPGQIALMDDVETLDFIRRMAENAQWVTSVCTGSLVLGAAGLLQGYRATSHWGSLDQLSLLGATPVAERVVRDRNRITGAGVTSGIDFALTVAETLFGRDVAENIQLQMEYDPAPPFNSGSPRSASAERLVQAKLQMHDFIARRRLATEMAAERLKR